MQLLVGLGNPGAQYVGTRHNIGFAVVERVAELLRAEPFRRQKKNLLARAQLGDGAGDVLLLKPQTFMNLSGDAVWPLAKFYQVAPQQLLVVHDELDLPVGTLRFKPHGGHGGHNGLRHLKSVLPDDFSRLRFGIGALGSRARQVDFVLSAFAAAERQAVTDGTERAAEAAVDALRHGLAAATRRLHAPPSPPA